MNRNHASWKVKSGAHCLREFWSQSSKLLGELMVLAIVCDRPNPRAFYQHLKAMLYTERFERSCSPHFFTPSLTHTHAHLRCTSFTFKFQMISQNLEHLELIRILWPGRQVCGSKNSISMSFISCHIQSNVETPSPAGRPRAVATSTHTKLNHFTHDLQKMNATVCLICQYLYLIMSNEVLQHINYNVLQRVISLNWVLWAIQTGFGTRFAALAVVSSRPSMARQGSDAEDMWSSCT